MYERSNRKTLLKLYTTKRERALGALNGTLLRVSLEASHKILFRGKKTYEKCHLDFSKH